MILKFYGLVFQPSVRLSQGLDFTIIFQMRIRFPMYGAGKDVEVMDIRADHSIRILMGNQQGQHHGKGCRNSRTRGNDSRPLRPTAPPRCLNSSGAAILPPRLYPLQYPPGDLLLMRHLRM